MYKFYLFLRFSIKIIIVKIIQIFGPKFDLNAYVLFVADEVLETTPPLKKLQLVDLKREKF
mgnify:CR=1 FL=1